MPGSLLTTLEVQHASGRGARVGWYSICGLLVRSEIPLPFPALAPGLGDGLVAAWTILRGDPEESLCIPDLAWPDGRSVDAVEAVTGANAAVFRWLSDTDGTWLWVNGLAAVHVSTDARWVRVFPDAGVDEQLVGLLAGGPLATFIMRELGHVLLHASAVATPTGAVAFIGPKGRGKSTMAAAFLKQGIPLLTDDILLLRVSNERVYGVPGPRIMKVWPSTAEHTLGLSSDLLPDLAPAVEKKLLRIDGQYSAAVDPQPLIGVYLLDRYTPSGEDGSNGESQISSDQLHGPQALGVVLSHAQGSVISSAAVAGGLPTLARLVNQAAVRVLHYPSSYQDQSAVCQHILAEVTTR